MVLQIKAGQFTKTGVTPKLLIKFVSDPGLKPSVALMAAGNNIISRFTSCVVLVPK